MDLWDLEEILGEKQAMWNTEMKILEYKDETIELKQFWLSNSFSTEVEITGYATQSVFEPAYGSEKSEYILLKVIKITYQGEEHKILTKMFRGKPLKAFLPMLRLRLKGISLHKGEILTIPLQPWFKYVPL